MENITYTMTFTFPKDSVAAFGKFIGYIGEATMQDPRDPTKTITATNPQSVFDYVAQKAKEHNEQFVTVWAGFLARQQTKAQVDAIQAQVDSQIVQPVKDAIEVTYE